MGLRSWFRRQLSGELTRIDLVTPARVRLKPPARAGLDALVIPAPWSVARLQALFEALAHQPSTESDQAARQARHQLSKFWLAAPVDQLQELYEGDIGDLQRLQMTGPLVQQDLAADEIRWRDQLLQRLKDPTRAAERVNLLLALMPYTQPRKLSVADPLSTLPDWLLNDYCVYCEPDLAAPVGLLEPAQPQTPETAPELEPLTDRRGEEAMVWFRDEAVVARMQELIQAYSADPTAADTRQELAGLRRVLAQLWLDVEPVQLQTLAQTTVGAVTRALILSGFGSELASDEDVAVRKQLSSAGADFRSPAAPAALLATLLFYPLEAVTFDTTDGLPVWFVDLLHELAAESVDG
ncbi:hypothetical protein SynA18461_00455 [Synechococcus sp. A18-46.1]|nr:hypothetical protein SynA18461_00455 [Synechococcus sp. A18-46.1]